MAAKPDGKKIKEGSLPSNHLWGCIQLARLGYEVAVTEPLPHFDGYRRPFPHDLKLLGLVRNWLRPEDIIYCGHTILYWLPLLKTLGVARRHLVSLMYARDKLDFSRAHSAIIALTPAAADQARKRAPKSTIAHLGWGADLSVYPRHPYNPEYLLHCGIAGRDFQTLHEATQECKQPVRLISPRRGAEEFTWPLHVKVVDGGHGYSHEDKKVTFSELVNEHYVGSAACLIVTIPNRQKDHALGFTNLIEALAMSQPIIQTRTGAVPDQIDVEKEGCGLTVSPGDPRALAAAMNEIMSNRSAAQEMGRNGRKLAETYYNIDRFANQLHELFESI